MTKEKTPHWQSNLKSLMEKQGLNPRSLSLRAGLNPTAVRDIFEGRTRFPRYDTVQALANALETTPACLMEDPSASAPDAQENDLDLMVEVISRLHEVVKEEGQTLTPRAFAVMAATLYRQIQQSGINPHKSAQIKSKIHDLLAYETLNRRTAKDQKKAI